MIFIELDLSAAEGRVLAYEAQEGNLIKIFDSGEDIHCVTANRMFGTPIDIIKKEEELLGHSTDSAEIQRVRELEIPEIFEQSEFPPPSTMTERQAGKKSLYGLGYGMEADRFSLENNIPLEDAKLLVRLFRRRAYPGLLDYYQEIQSELKNNDRTLVNAFGRRIRLAGAWGPSLFNQGYSFKPQSTVADIVVEAMCNFWEERDLRSFKPAILALQVHDSLAFRYPESDLELLPDFISGMLGPRFLCPPVTIKGRTFTIPVDWKIGYNLGKMEKVKEPRLELIQEVLEKLRS